MILFPIGKGSSPVLTALAASAPGPVACAACAGVRPWCAAVSALPCRGDATNTLSDTTADPKSALGSVRSKSTKVIVQSVVTPSVSFSSPNEICRSPSVVFKVKATLRAIGNAAGTIPAVGMAAGAGVGAAGAGGAAVGAAGVGAAAAGGVVVESSGEFEIVDVAIFVSPFKTGTRAMISIVNLSTTSYHCAPSLRPPAQILFPQTSYFSFE